MTLTNVEAEKEYGSPPEPLLSSGTVKDIDELSENLGYGSATPAHIEPTGAEKTAFWINAIGPLLLLVGHSGTEAIVEAVGWQAVTDLAVACPVSLPAPQSEDEIVRRAV